MARQSCLCDSRALYAFATVEKNGTVIVPSSLLQSPQVSTDFQWFLCAAAAVTASTRTLLEKTNAAFATTTSAMPVSFCIACFVLLRWLPHLHRAHTRQMEFCGTKLCFQQLRSYLSCAGSRVFSFVFVHPRRRVAGEEAVRAWFVAPCTCVETVDTLCRCVLCTCANVCGEIVH